MLYFFTIYLAVFSTNNLNAKQTTFCFITLDTLDKIHVSYILHSSDVTTVVCYAAADYCSQDL